MTVAEKVVEQVATKGTAMGLRIAGLFATLMFMSHEAGGNDDSIWNDGREQRFHELQHKKSQGTLTGQEKNELNDLYQHWLWYTKGGREGEGDKGNIANKIGADFENLLVNKLGGKGGFKSEGRQFDGAFDNVWYEAKGGNFWTNVGLKNVDKWKSSFGHYNSIAKRNGKVFQVYSQKEIPQVFKSYFDKKGIQYFENVTK